MIPLSMADVGSPQIVKKIGGSPEVRQHLETLGFHVGGEVCIVSTLAGNLIVKVKESRVAVDEALARKIMV
ncbi:MAG: ferrous iron transport protein A [Clostridia bacterium]|nr:ferrous iron transport protein A [Clostridia bacterium]